MFRETFRKKLIEFIFLIIVFFISLAMITPESHILLNFSDCKFHSGALFILPIKDIFFSESLPFFISKLFRIYQFTRVLINFIHKRLKYLHYIINNFYSTKLPREIKGYKIYNRIWKINNKWLVIMFF